MSIEGDLGRVLHDRGLVIAIAESCTGGALSARIVSCPGASRYFRGGIVAYSNEVKIELLGVQRRTIEVYGAVSEETAQEMACGLLKKIAGDYGVALSGIAGPEGGSDLTPVGTVCAAIADKDGIVERWTFHKEGGRCDVIEKTIEEVLVKLIDVVQRHE